MRNLKIAKTKKLFLLVPALLALVLSAGCNALFPPEEEMLPPILIETQKVEYVTQPAERKLIENTITGYATIKAENQTDVFFTDTSGRLKNFYFKEGEWVNEGDLICELENADLKIRLEEAEMRAEIAELVFQRARTQYRSGEMDEISWKTAELNIFITRRDLQSLRDSLAHTQLYAPTSGVMVFKTEASIGSNISPYSTICTLADASDLVILYQGSRSDEIPVGAICIGTFRDDLNKVEYPCKVISSPHTNKDNTVPLKMVSETAFPESVTLGDLMDIKFVVERSENAICVPRRAIKTMGTRTYLYVFADGYKQERDVKVGIYSSNEAEIIEGINEGDLIIY